MNCSELQWLQWVAVGCSGLHWVVVGWVATLCYVAVNELQSPSRLSTVMRGEAHRTVFQCVAVCCSVLRCVAVCCSVLQYVAIDVLHWRWR